MGYRWKPSASQKAAYHAKMVSIEQEQSKPVRDGYEIGCTGDCCNGDEIAYFNAGKSGERLYGKIISESYGHDKQQHTFTIELDNGEKQLIKGRNLYKMGVLRKAWENEEKRKEVLDEKHERGNIARTEAKSRKEKTSNSIPDWALGEEENTNW